MKKVYDYLEQLGFSQIEAKLYLTLLKSGPLTVQELAKTTGINRTAAYPYLTSLLDKGVIIEVRRQARKKFIATEPENLRYLIERKFEKIKTVETNFPTILNVINNSLTKNAIEAQVDTKSYKGVVNARKIYLEALRANELRTFIKIDKNESLFPNNATVFSEAFTKNKKLKVWEIIYDIQSSAVPSAVSRSRRGRYFYKYMPKRLKFSSEDILIYDEKVAIINFRGEKTSIVLHSSDFYNNFVVLFDFMWQMLPEPTKQ